MALATKCQTPGAEYGTRINAQDIEVWVELPKPLGLTDDDARQLEKNLHNAVEMVLAPYFTEGRR